MNPRKRDDDGISLATAIALTSQDLNLIGFDHKLAFPYFFLGFFLRFSPYPAYFPWESR